MIPLSSTKYSYVSSDFYLTRGYENQKINIDVMETQLQ